MPNYEVRDLNVNDENFKGGAMEILNMYGADKVVPEKVEDTKEEPNELIGGVISDIMNSKVPHKEMIRKVLQMKPKDIHILKRSSNYFLDNPNELKEEIDGGILTDLGDTKNSNDLADMLESDYEMSSGGELDGSTLLEGLATVLHSIPKIQKQFS
tara:strand:- start:3986 stop:4453 length:468 start_codon:yes stop_codon:yes gene_type:complete